MNHTPSLAPHTNGRLLAAGIALVLSLAALPAHLSAQGCVPIKEMGDSTVDIGGVTTGSAADKWDFTESYEHFRSYLDFIGSNNNTAARNAATNQVINVVDQFDSSISYTPDVVDTFTLDVPYFTATRSQQVSGLGRYKTRGRGIGDTRVTADRWLIDPRTNPRGDISLGLGLSIPTGKSNVKDYFHTKTGLVLENVDQSIQPGEGGWGLIGEFNAYYKLLPSTSLYANGFYMVTPQDTNGTRTTSAITSETAYDSVYDQYELRGGVTQVLWRFNKSVLTGSLGGRWEGVPSDDLIGSSDGFRRPGYVLSVEPGLAYLMPHDSFTFSVPVAEYMNRTQSYPDTLTGGHGDAFFAKFLVLASYSHRW
ncbi:MAG TPA: hypothetical protein VGG34_14045 [Opitutaceae bacterium]|jgi:hypothetical protein